MKRRKLNRNALNEQYGFDFGDKVLNALGKALKCDFGKTSAIGRYAGHRFAVLAQVKNKEEAHALRAKIKATAKSIRQIGGVPVTLYLSVGYVLFSETLDLEEQARPAWRSCEKDYEPN